MSRSRSLISITVIALSGLAAAARADSGSSQSSLQSLSQGKPALMDEVLAPSAYKRFKTKRLANAHINWVNFNWLRAHGIRVPDEGLTPEFEKKLLDAFAYQIPDPKDPVENFLDKVKYYWADYYGGMGMNGNLGSGRAGSAGKAQIKGIGATPMVGPKVEDSGHATGGMFTPEAMNESQWSTVLSDELPHGSNQAIAVIDTGNVLHWADGKPARPLMVREDDLRPAHELGNESVDGDLAVHDKIRVNDVHKKLLKALPMPANRKFGSSAERLRAGLNEFFDRVARQYAFMYSRRIFHGATSPSNILMNGRMIDYGTITAKPDFARMKILDDELPFGDSLEQKRSLLFEIVKDFKKTLPPELRSAVPTRSEVARYYDRAYGKALNEEMISLSGVPPELRSAVAESSPRLSARFAETLLKIARAGNDHVYDPTDGNPRHKGRYNLRKILNRAASLEQADRAKLSRGLAELIDSPADRALFVRTYAEYFDAVRDAAKKTGIKAASLAEYVKGAAEIRNSDMKELFTSEAWDDAYGRVESKVKKTGDRRLYQDYVDGVVERSLRTFRDAGPFRVVTNESSNRVAGTAVRRVYDAKKGAYYTVYRTQAAGESAYLSGKSRPVKDLLSSTIGYESPEHPGELRTARPKLNNGYVEFQIPENALDPHLALGGASEGKVIALERNSFLGRKDSLVRCLMLGKL